jgi:hypothetical protein
MKEQDKDFSDQPRIDLDIHHTHEKLLRCEN